MTEHFGANHGVEGERPCVCRRRSLARQTPSPGRRCRAATAVWATSPDASRPRGRPGSTRRRGRHPLPVWCDGSFAQHQGADDRRVAALKLARVSTGWIHGRTQVRRTALRTIRRALVAIAAHHVAASPAPCRPGWWRWREEWRARTHTMPPRRPGRRGCRRQTPGRARCHRDLSVERFVGLYLLGAGAAEHITRQRQGFLIVRRGSGARKAAHVRRCDSGPRESSARSDPPGPGRGT